MFHRSLLVFLAFALLVLTVIVSYALIGLSGPETTIAEARAALEAGRGNEAVRVLNLAEDSLGPAGASDLRREVLTLRYQAHLQTDNYRSALVDLRQLVQTYARGDANLERETVRVQIASGEPAEALARARQTLARTPNDGRMLELAGEACQAMYQVRFAELLGDLSVNLPPDQYELAVQSLLPYLYRADSDQLAREGKARFEEILRQHRIAAHIGRVYQPALDEVRRLIAQAQTYYRRSLECPGTPVSAYLGLAYALAQGHRDDEGVALAETYMRRFDHLFTTRAAVNAARIHLANRRSSAVVELVARFLPWNEWRTQLEEGQINSEVRLLLLEKARALRALGDVAGLQRLVTQMDEMAGAGLELDPEAILIRAYHAELAGEPVEVENLLKPFYWLPAVRQMPKAESYLAETMQMRFEAATRAKAQPWVFDQLFRRWIELDPQNPIPYGHQARHRLKLDQTDEALLDATTSFRLAPHDEQALALFAEATDRVMAKGNRGSKALLEQCVRLGASLPRDVADNVLYLTLARRALDAKVPDVALAAARRATQNFNWSTWPRQLWAEAALAAGRAEEAAQTLQALHDDHPNDARIVELLRDARRQAGLSNDQLLYDVALTGARDTELATALLRRSLARGDPEQAAEFARGIAVMGLPDAKLPVLIASALAAAGDRETAEKILSPMIQMVQMLPSDVAGPALEAYLTMMAPDGNPAVLTGISLAALLLHRQDAAALLRMATILEAHDQPDIAYRVLQPVFEQAGHHSERTGAHYALAGKLALARSQPEEAETYLTAALAFPDGQEAAKWLALLLLRAGEDARAADAYWSRDAENVADAALLLQLGRVKPAIAWVRKALLEEPENVRLQCLQALCDAERCESLAALQLAQRAPTSLRRALLFGGIPGFAAETLAATEELIVAIPTSPIATVLWARALADSDRAEEALRALRSVGDRLDYLPAYDEMLQLEIEPDAELQARLDQLVLRDPKTAPPAARAQVLKHRICELRATPNPSDAVTSELARTWIEFPEATGAGLPEFQALVKLGRYAEALELLDILDRRVEADARPAFVAAFAAAARPILASNKDAAFTAKILQRLEVMLQRDGPYGVLVHLLLQHGKVANENELLQQHLDFFERGSDPDDDAVRQTLRRLVRLNGRPAALLRIEQLLRADVSLVPLWILRAQLLREQGDSVEASRGLMWLTRYLQSPEVLLTMCDIAGRAGIPALPQDLALRNLGLEADNPAVAFARGLLAYRVGSYAAATELLANATKQADGAHLYFRALAYLAIPGDAARERAADLLRTFVTRYPDSNLSEIAGHLAKQLAVRSE